MTGDTWQRPGDMGQWISPTGTVHWLYPTDHPASLADGRLVLVRACPTSSVSILSLVQRQKQVLVADPDGGAFRFAGLFGLDPSGKIFVHGVVQPDGSAVKPLGLVESAEVAVVVLVEHAASLGLPPARNQGSSA